MASGQVHGPPNMDLNLSVRKKDYNSFSFKCPQVNKGVSVQVKLDTCAQSCLWSFKDCLNAGFTRGDLIPVTFSMSAANKSRIEIIGALFIRLDGVSKDGKNISSATMVYVSPKADGFFLSLEAMVDLELIKRNSPLFPDELKRPDLKSAHTSLNECDTVSMSCSESSRDGSTCSCPVRTYAISRPQSLPFEAKPENNS